MDGGSGPAVTVADVALSLSGLTLTGRYDTYGGSIVDATNATLTTTTSWFKDATGDLSRALDVSGGDVTIEASTFTGNDVAVVLSVHDGGSLTVRTSVFSGNTSEGILAASDGDLDFSDNLLTDNTFGTNLVTVVGASSTSQWVWNNTIYGNTGTCGDTNGGCPAIYVDNAGRIENNIVADNSMGGIYVVSPEQVTVQYNDSNGNGIFDICLMGRYECDSNGLEAGNITSDPKLTDPEANDFSLTGFSPCIDAGNPLTGYDDVDGTRNDMGAFGGPYGGWTP